MLGYSEFLKLLSYLIKAITSIYLPLLSIMWDSTLKYALLPASAFPTESISNSQFLSLYAYIYRGSIPILVSIAIAGAALLIVSPIGISKNNEIRGFYVRFPVSIIVAVSSLLIFTALFQFLGLVYGILFSHAGTSISSFSSVTGITLISSDTGSLSLLSTVFRFILLSAYFLAIGSILSILIFRQALLLVLVILMPFLTIISIMDVGRKYAIRGWELTIELTLFQFAALLSIMLAGIFRSDVPLNLAFLFLPSVLPGYLLLSGRGLSSTPILGFIGGMTLGSSTARVGGMAAAIVESRSGGSPLPLIASGALLPAADYKSIQGIRIARKSPESITADAIREELKYRKDDY